MAQLRLSFLGSPEVWCGEQIVTFPTRKALALLVYLAVEGGLQPREKLLALFWPDSDLTRGRGALRTTLAYLRRALDALIPTGSADYLLIEPDTLGFNFTADFELDIHTVATALDAGRELAWQRAIQLYRGDFLEGFSLPDAPAFDDWASLQREHWHRYMNGIFERLSHQQAAARQFEAGIATATRWVAHDPVNEVAQRRLMQLYFMAGDRTAALQAYAACQAALKVELGVEPSPETKALAERIRKHDFGHSALGVLPILDFGLKANRSKIHARASAGSPKSKIEEIPFVGRSAEHTQLAAIYKLVQQSGAQVGVVEGEAGIGKTRLVSEFLSWVTVHGADTLEGRAFEAGGRLPYQPVVDALRDRIEQENAPDDLLGDVWLAELSRLLPELRERYPDLPPPTPDETLARTRLPEAVVRLGEALAKRQPVVIFIDDIQWADTASLDLLHYIGRRWAEDQMPLLILLTLRSEALLTTPALGEWLANVERDLPVNRLRLGPITAEDTVQLVDTLAGETKDERRTTNDTTSLVLGPSSSVAFSKWLFSETAGQPFYIAETIKVLVERGVLPARIDAGGGQTLDFTKIQLDEPLIPPSVRQIILARINRLSPTATALLTAAAVIGRNCSFERLGQVAGIAEMEGLPALDELLTSRLLLETDDLSHPYRFTHDKIRDVVYTEAGNARRRIFHRRAFEALEAATAYPEPNRREHPERSRRPAERAHHALNAGLVEPAFRYGVAAGDEAMRLFAVRDAIVHYEQAKILATGDRGPGTGQEAIPNPKSQIQNLHHLYLQLGRAYELTNEWAKARATYEAMLTFAQEADSPEIECTALNRLATMALQGSAYDLTTAATLLQQALGVAESSGDKVGLAEIEWSLAQLGLHTLDLENSIIHGRRAVSLAQELEMLELRARSLNILAFTEMGVSQWADTEAHAEEARTLYEILGNRAMQADCLGYITLARVNGGQLEAAVSAGQTAWAISFEIENGWGQTNNAFQLALALLECGEYVQALTLAQRGLAMARSLGVFAPMQILNLIVLGNIYRAMLALEQAQTTHLEAMTLSETMPSPMFVKVVAAELCADCALIGDWSEAHAYARQALAAPFNSLLHGGLNHWYETEALLHGGSADAELARMDVRQFGERFASNRRYRIPYLRCLAVLDLSPQLPLLPGEGIGRVRSAMAHLQEAAALAEEMGLPGEQWQILATLGELYQASGDKTKAQQVMKRAAEIVQTLAAKIDDEGLRAGFLMSDPIRRVLAAGGSE
jgi:DNA-binding SARP family transcriptional activator/tetratricopeptide (TPR) repeat protein